MCAVRAVIAPTKRMGPGRKTMDHFILLGVVVFWLALQFWILPKLGVLT